MGAKEEILNEIRKKVLLLEPNARLILFGKNAVKKEIDNNNYDILILVYQAFLNRKSMQSIKSTLYDIEQKFSITISPVIIAEESWQTDYANSSFYDEIVNTGVEF